MPDRDTNVAGVILAAGMSRRVGQLKQTLDWAGRSILRHVTQTLLDAELNPVHVVLGYERERLADELAGLDVRIVENRDYEAGMFGSVRRGLAALPNDATCCVLALVDQPRVPAAVVRRLVDEHLLRATAVTTPRYLGQTGHPVVLGRIVIEAVLAAPADSTLRNVLAPFADRTHYVDLDDSSVIADIDTWEDYVEQRPNR